MPFQGNPSWVIPKRREVMTVKYEKPQISHVEDAGKAIQLMTKEVAIADANRPGHLPPSDGVFESND